MKLPKREAGGHVRWSSGEGGIGPGRPELLREVNARRVLRLLRLRGPCSRADLVRSSGLSAPTISSGVAYLQKKGLVEPMGPGESNGGRPPDMLRFNSKLGYVVGADIGSSVVRVALADLNGTAIEEWVAPTDSQSTPERVAGLIMSGIRELQNRRKVPSKKLLALAAGVPGITDTRAGTVLSAPNLPSGWGSVPLAQILESQTGIAAVIENDVNLAALGESWCGTARGVKNFVFLTIGAGVGAGIFVNGRLYHGSDWAAGEIGYLYVPGTEETPLAIRRPGSLESIIGDRGIQRLWRELAREGHRSSRRRLRDLSGIEIFDLAEQGQSPAAEVLHRTARILADAITNVCVILNCSLVVFGGRIGSHPTLFRAASQILERNEFCRPRLALSTLGRKAQLYGAIWLALNAAEGMILPSAIGTSRTSRPEEVLGLLQPFLGLALPEVPLAGEESQDPA